MFAKRFRTLGIVLAILLSLFTVNSYAASYYYDASHHEIVISGEFTEATEYNKFNKLLDDHPDVKGVRLVDSPGGDATDMIGIGLRIHQDHLWTWASGYCHSACGYIWLAGDVRYADKNAFLAEHLPNVNNIISIDSFNILAYYLGLIQMPYGLVGAIESSSNYFDNKPFDFLQMIDAADPQHKFYVRLAADGAPPSY